MYESFESGFCKTINCDPASLSEGQRGVIKLAYIQASQQQKRPFYKNPWVLGGAAALGAGAYGMFGNPTQDFQNASDWLKGRFSGSAPQTPPATPPAPNLSVPSTPEPAPKPTLPVSTQSMPQPPPAPTPSPIRDQGQLQAPKFNANSAGGKPFDMNPKPLDQQAWMKELANVPEENILRNDTVRQTQQALQNPGLPLDTRKEAIKFLQEMSQSGHAHIPPHNRSPDFTDLVHHLKGEPILPTLASGEKGQQFVHDLTKYRSGLPSWAEGNPYQTDIAELGGLPFTGVQGATALASGVNPTGKPLADLSTFGKGKEMLGRFGQAAPKYLTPVGTALDVPAGYELGDMAAFGINDKLKNMGLSTYDEPPQAMRGLMGTGGAIANSALNLLPASKSQGAGIASNVATGTGQSLMSDWLQNQKSQTMNQTISSNWMNTYASKNKELMDAFAQADQGNTQPLQQWTAQNRQILPAIWKTMTYLNGDPTKGQSNRSVEVMMEKFDKHQNTTGIPLDMLMFGAANR